MANEQKKTNIPNQIKRYKQKCYDPGGQAYKGKIKL